LRQRGDLENSSLNFFEVLGYRRDLVYKHAAKFKTAQINDRQLIGDFVRDSVKLVTRHARLFSPAREFASPQIGRERTYLAGPHNFLLKRRGLERAEARTRIIPRTLGA
jgi:hypothetical protein